MTIGRQGRWIHALLILLSCPVLAFPAPRLPASGTGRFHPRVAAPIRIPGFGSRHTANVLPPDQTAPSRTLWPGLRSPFTACAPILPSSVRPPPNHGRCWPIIQKALAGVKDNPMHFAKRRKPLIGQCKRGRKHFGQRHGPEFVQNRNPIPDFKRLGLYLILKTAVGHG